MIEIQTDIPLTPNIQPDELIVKAEYADFLEQTGLNKSQEPIDLKITIPGGYQKLLDEISVRRRQMEEETSQGSFASGLSRKLVPRNIPSLRRSCTRARHDALVPRPDHHRPLRVDG